MTGELTITLDKVLDPESQLLTQLLSQSSEVEAPILKLELVGDETYEVERDLAFTWTTVSVTGNLIKIVIQFDKPYEVSSGFQPDLLKIGVQQGVTTIDETRLEAHEDLSVALTGQVGE